MARLRIRPAGLKAKRIEAVIEKGEAGVTEVAYDVIKDHYYLCRVGGGYATRIIVLKATGEYLRDRPTFIPAAGEYVDLGDVKLLVMADLGTEEP